MQGLAYHYPTNGTGSPFRIKDIGFSLRRGDFVVITGRIGSGKTTLLRALLGLLPAHEGTVLWNGTPVLDRAAFFTPPHSAYTAQIPTSSVTPCATTF